MFIKDRLIKSNDSSSTTHCSFLTDNIEYMNYLINENKTFDIIISDLPYNSAVSNSSYSFIDSMNQSDYETFLLERFKRVHEILRKKGILVVFINHVSLFKVGSMLDTIFGAENRISIVTWNKQASHLRSKFIRNVSEYILIYAKDKKSAEAFSKIKNDTFNIQNFEEDDTKNKYRWRNALAPASSFEAKYCYKYITKDGEVAYPLSKENFEDAQGLTNSEAKAKGLRSFKYSKERIYKSEVNNELKIEDGKLFIKEYVKDEKSATNIISSKSMNYKTSAFFIQNILQDEAMHFTYAKPISLYLHLFELMNLKSDDIDYKSILDIFGGSGTTLSAILYINQKYNKNHHVTLLESNEAIFNTQTRIIEKLIHGYEYKNRNDRIIKVEKLDGILQTHHFESS